MKLFKIISILTLTATFTGCHFGGGVTVVHPKKKTTTVVYEEPSHTHTTVVVEEPSPQPSSSSTVVVYEDPAYFYCDDGSVIPSEWVCDGWDGCWGGEDEHYCGGSVVVVEEYHTPEPYYHDYCEYVDFYGDEECCYDYDWNVVWINSHEYVYEVCEYTSCVDYDFGILTQDTVNCWYE